MILQYYMLRGDGVVPRNVFPPVRENPSDAGLDLRWTPTEVSETLFKIDPGQSVLVPTGCKFAIPHGYMLEIKNKSGVAHKKQLLAGTALPAHDRYNIMRRKLPKCLLGPIAP